MEERKLRMVFVDWKKSGLADDRMNYITGRVSGIISVCIDDHYLVPKMMGPHRAYCKDGKIAGEAFKFKATDSELDQIRKYLFNGNTLYPEIITVYDNVEK